MDELLRKKWYTFLLQHFCTGLHSFDQACGSVGRSVDLGRVSGGTSRVRDSSCQVSTFDQYRIGSRLSSTITSFLFYTVCSSPHRPQPVNTETLLYLIHLRIFYSSSVNPVDFARRLQLRKRPTKRSPPF